MIEESLLKSNFSGKDGFVWWIGQVADPSVWRNEKSRVDSSGSWAYRCKVRIIGYHTFDGGILPDSDLPWAHVLTSASDGAPGQGGFGKLPQLVGGESVLGFFLDGDEAQQPVIVSCFYRNTSVQNLITPELVQQERSSQFRPFTGMQGAFSPSHTRIKRPDRAQSSTPNRVTTNQGPAFTFSQAANADFGVDTTGLVGVTSSFSTSNFNAGAVWNTPNLVSDQLFYDDISSVGFLKAFDDQPPVSDDNGCQSNFLADIESALQGFMKFINGLEQTALGFIDPVRNLVVDVRSKIRKVAKLIMAAMKFIMNGMRDNIIKLVGCLFRAFAITVPLPQWMQISEAARNIIDLIFCIFENIFGNLLDFVLGMLENLIGRSNNAPRCAAEEMAASLIEKLGDLVEDGLSEIISGIDWLTAGLGQITGYIRDAVNFLQQVLSFLDCDQLKCKPRKVWDPFKGLQFPDTDEWANTLNNIDILAGLGGDVDEWTGLLSMYGSADTPFTDCREKIVNPQTQEDMNPMPIGVRFYSCVPPRVIINGNGTGARGIAVIEPRSGSVLTIRVLDPGRGYTQPPSVSIVDNSNYGSGATAEATINRSGNIESIYITQPGFGYCQTNLNDVSVGSTTPSIGIGSTTPGIGIGGTNIGISTTPVGIITNVVVTQPGVGYTSGDTINIGQCRYSPILTPNGSIIGVTSATYCTTEYTELPDSTINTNTGQGAVVRPVLQYIPQYTTDNPNLRDGLSQTDIIIVDNCCDDCD